MGEHGETPLLPSAQALPLPVHTHTPFPPPRPAGPRIVRGPPPAAAHRPHAAAGDGDAGSGGSRFQDSQPGVQGPGLWVFSRALGIQQAYRESRGLEAAVEGLEAEVQWSTVQGLGPVHTIMQTNP